MEKLRLQKYMADCGLMSRRAAEKEIEAGKVTVNGVVAKLGDSVTSEGWVDSGVPIMTCFHPLGKGTVNFPAILDILDKAGYKGYLCIELDCAPDSNAESAKKNYDYLCSLVED